MTDNLGNLNEAKALEIVRRWEEANEHHEKRIAAVEWAWKEYQSNDLLRLCLEAKRFLEGLAQGRSEREKKSEVGMSGYIDTSRLRGLSPGGKHSACIRRIEELEAELTAEREKAKALVLTLEKIERDEGMCGAYVCKKAAKEALSAYRGEK